MADYFSFNPKKEEFGISFDEVSPFYKFGEIEYYQFVLTGNNIVDLLENGDLVYAYDYQRGKKVTPKGKETPVVYANQVKGLMEAIVKGDLHNDTIYWNVDSNEAKIDFSEEDGTIEINAPVGIIAGWHRTIALKKLKAMYDKDNTLFNPESVSFNIRLYNKTIGDACKIFVSEGCLAKSISKARHAYFASQDPNIIINNVIRKVVNESVLNGQIDMVSAIPGRKSSNIYGFSGLTRAIKEHFKPSSTQDAEKIGNFLIKFFNELADMFKNEFTQGVENRYEIRKKSMIIEPIALFGWMAIAKYMVDDEDWKIKLLEAKNKVKNGILSRSYPLYQGIVIKEGDKMISGSSAQKTIENVFIQEFYPEKLEAQEETEEIEVVAEEAKEENHAS